MSSDLEKAVALIEEAREILLDHDPAVGDFDEVRIRVDRLLRKAAIFLIVGEDSGPRLS